jgi:hypothetical protein
MASHNTTSSRSPLVSPRARCHLVEQTLPPLLLQCEKHDRHLLANITKFSNIFLTGIEDLTRQLIGPAQACSPLLRLSTNFGTLRRRMLKCFNSSPVGPDLVPYIKMAKIGPHFENEQSRLAFTSYIFSCCLSDPLGLSFHPLTLAPLPSLKHSYSRYLTP